MQLQETEMGVFNFRSQKENRQALRKIMPPAEVILWSKLRRQQLGGFKFRRQYSVSNFVIFYCAEAKLGLEVDGESHFVDGAAEKDSIRQQYIEQQGIRMVRFTNTEVYECLDGLLESLLKVLNERMRELQTGNIDYGAGSSGS
jgi:very-short-patch-repair endonuclease